MLYGGNKRVNFVVGDIRDYESIKFALNKIDYVFHAAALKQVPTAEIFPLESIKTNALGAENLIRAVKYVNKNKGSTLSLLGFDGGKLLKLCDSSILVKTKKGEFGPVEDAHLIINHIIAHWFQNKLNN